MKNYVLLVVITTIFLACNSNNDKQPAVSADSGTAVIVKPADSSAIKDMHYFWAADIVGKQGLVMTKTRPLSPDSLSAPIIVQVFNEMYPEIPITVNKIAHDSIFIKIGNSKYLTQQMGSSGPETYFAELTYNLTEVPGINYVDFNFKEGQHAAPATYSRTDFVQVKN
jgi:hypothetical protein